MRSKKLQEKEIGKISRSNQYKSDSITVFYGQLVLSNFPSSTDSVRKFCPFPVEVKEDDPRRVLLKDRFKFIIYSYDNVLNSDYVERGMVIESVISQKINYKYFYNDVSQKLDRNIVVESNSPRFINEGRDRVALLTSFLDVMNLQGREIFIVYISLTKSDEFRVELNQGLKEWDASFEKFFSRVSKIRVLVNEENKGLINLDKKFTLALWNGYTGFEVDVWPYKLLDSMRDEVKVDPRFLILREWYNNIRKWSKLVLEKHTCRRLEFRCSLISYQWTLKYYFGCILEELESHINTNKSSCESDDVGVLLVKEFINGSFKGFRFQVDDGINRIGLSKASQFKIKENIKEIRNSFDGFIKRSKKLTDKVNKVKKKKYPTSKSSLKVDFKPELVERMAMGVEVRGVGTFHITRQMVSLDPRLLLLNDSCRYSQDICDYLLNNVLGSKNHECRKIVEGLEKYLIFRHDEVKKQVTNKLFTTYFHPKIFNFDESVVKINNFVKECKEVGIDAFKSLIRKTSGKQRKELRILLKEWKFFSQVFADRGSLLMSDSNVLKSYLLRPLMKRLSLEELKKLSIELAKEAYPSSFGLNIPMDSGLTEKDPRYVLVKDILSFFIKICSGFLSKLILIGIDVPRNHVRIFKSFIISSINIYLPKLYKHISSSISSPHCGDSDEGIVLARAIVKDINAMGTDIITEAFNRVKSKKHRRKFDEDLQALNIAYVIFTKRADRLVEDVNSFKSNAVVRKDGK